MPTLVLGALILLPVAAAPAGDTPGHERPAVLRLEFGGPFSLIDHQGRRRTDKDFRGRHMLIFFGYAQCRSICPVGLDHMAKALDALGPLGNRIQPIFITVDPDNDTPDALGALVRAIHPRLIGLTGTRDELRAAARAYGVRTRLLTEPGDKEPIYAHNSFMFLMRPDGAFATLFPPVMSPEAIAASVRRYLE